MFLFHSCSLGAQLRARYISFLIPACVLFSIHFQSCTGTSLFKIGGCDGCDMVCRCYIMGRWWTTLYLVFDRFNQCITRCIHFCCCRLPTAGNFNLFFLFYLIFVLCTVRVFNLNLKSISFWIILFIKFLKQITKLLTPFGFKPEKLNKQTNDWIEYVMHNNSTACCCCFQCITSREHTHVNSKRILFITFFRYFFCLIRTGFVGCKAFMELKRWPKCNKYHPWCTAF